MTRSLLLLAFIIVIIFTNFIYHYEIRNTLFLVFGLAAFAVNRHYPNIYGLLLIILLVRGMETLFWLLIEGNSAYIVYPVQMALDALVIALIHYRWRIHVYLNKNLKINQIVFTNADYHLSQVYVAYGLIAFMALIEHIIRHPYDIGLPMSWSVPDLLYVYYAIDYVRLVLEILQYVIILFFAHSYLSSPKNMKA